MMHVYAQATALPEMPPASVWPMVQSGAALVIVGLQTWLITTVRDLRDEVRRLNHHIFGVQGNNGLTSDVVKLWSDQDRQDDVLHNHDTRLALVEKRGTHR